VTPPDTDLVIPYDLTIECPQCHMVIAVNPGPVTRDQNGYAWCPEALRHATLAIGVHLNSAMGCTAG
jgi:hypothetical protein